MIDYQVRMTELAPGNAGIVATARRMRGMILDHDPLTRQVAEDVLLELPGQPDTYRQAEALYQWVQDHLQYVHDHVHVEEVRNSNFLVNKILSAPGQRAAGDCDDYVVLLGSLLTAVGIPVAIVLTSARPDGEYDHVFLRVQTSQGLVTADAIPIGETAPEYMPFGWEVPAGAVTNRLELPVGSSQASGGGHPVGRLGQDSTLVTTDPTMAQPFADPSTGVAIDAALQDPFVPGSSAMDTVTDPAGIISTTYATGAVLETHPDGSYVYNSPDRTWISFDAATGLTTQGAPDGSTVTYDSSFNTVSSTPPATASPTDIAGAVIAPSGQIQASPAGGWTPQAVNAILGTVLGFGSAALKTFGAQLPAGARKAPSGYAWSYQDPSGMTRRTTDLSTISLDQVRSVPTLVPISRLPGASRAGVAGAGVTGFLTQKIGPLPLWAWGALGWGATRALGARRG